MHRYFIITSQTLLGVALENKSQISSFQRNVLPLTRRVTSDQQENPARIAICKKAMDPKSLPIEESLDKPYPYPMQESEDQRWLAYSQQRRQWRERVSENPPNWSDLAHLFTAKIRRIGNVSIAKFVTYLVAVAMEILKIFSVQKWKTREREEMRTKMEEIKNTKLKEIELHKWKLDEQVFFFSCVNTLFS